MDKKISTDTKAELVQVLRIQYRKSSKREKTRILDQFIAVSGYQSKRRRHRPKKVGKQIPVRTFADCGSPNPGYLEIDFVVHAGGLMVDSLWKNTLVIGRFCRAQTTKKRFFKHQADILAP